MSDQIKKVTKPYIYESLAALFIDVMVGLFIYLFVAIVMHDFVGALLFAAPMLPVALVFDVPLLVKCIRDRKTEAVLEVGCTLENVLEDASHSNKFRLAWGESSLLTTWYYPKEWYMKRYKLILKTRDGKTVKPRSIHSRHHGQLNFWIDLCGIQEKVGDQMLFRVRYCKYSKALLSMSMIGYPPDMKKRTKEYIDSNLRDILRWTTKV